MSPQLAAIVDERRQIFSIARFLSSGKHGGLWDCSVLREQYSDVVTVGLMALWGLIGRFTELSDFEIH